MARTVSSELQLFEMEDNYVLCVKCKEFHVDFCSVHGPLIVIPDTKVPTKNPSPPFIPRAALTIPTVFLHIATSQRGGLGIFSTVQLPAGVSFGPYRGMYSDTASSARCWLIQNAHKSYMIDGGDADRSNWMRYVNCSYNFDEQNLTAYQYNGRIFYRTIKSIPPNTELLVFYGSEYARLLGIDLTQYNSFIDKGTDVKLSQNLRKTEVDAGNTRDYPEINKHTQKPDSSDISHACDECNKRFKLKRNFTRHKKTHSLVKRFCCKYCKYQTNELYILKEHVNSHTKEVDYICEICSKVFYIKKSYKKHKRIHTRCH